ncbi:unnamed protein product [Paramecium octaurelia]|uniref:Uncharacterized protein n=1 Tax=Paramecium octaurelia TaxID=43137 RepID=A0A8S1XZ35_PAROT|nr:unnamed protein product [Paramecium octaurelia]
MQCSMHNQQLIQFACLNQSCYEFKLACDQCTKNNFHLGHVHNLKSIPELLGLLSDTQQQCNEFINKLNILNAQINELLKHVNQFVEIDFSITSQTLTQISTQQLNNIITKLIHFNGDNKPQIQLASQHTEKLIQCFSNFLQTFKITDIQTRPNNKTSDIALPKYQLINSIKEYLYCFSVCFNQDSTIMINGYMDGIIRVFEFNQGNIKLKQTLSEHKGIVGCLNFMNNSNSFVSGSLDNDIIIWKFFENKQWRVQQKITGHRNWIRCILINSEDNLIISGSRDFSIKFWTKDKTWQCSQTLNQHKNELTSMSLNESQTYLISCAYDDDEILISKQQENKQWMIAQKINQKGYRLCFINNNLFTVQQYLIPVMNIYELNNSTNLFDQIKEVKVKNGPSCHCFFQSQYIQQKQMLVCKNGNYVNIIKISQSVELQLVQFIDFGTGTLFGRLTDDGQFMVTWDDKTQQIQIFQFKEK